MMAVLLLLVALISAPYLLPYLFSLYWRIPAYIKRKLWEIPRQILPLIENLMAGLLHQMEQRILERLTEMPKDVAYAVTGGVRKGIKTVKKAGQCGMSVVRRKKSRRKLFSKRV